MSTDPRICMVLNLQAGRGNMLDTFFVFSMTLYRARKDPLYRTRNCEHGSKSLNVDILTEPFCDLQRQQAPMRLT